MYFVYDKSDGLCVFSHNSLKKCIRHVSCYGCKSRLVIFSVEFVGGRCLLSEVSYYDPDECRFRSSDACTFIDLDFFFDPNFG